MLTWKLSINGKVINCSKEVVFLVTGSSKAQKIDEIHHKKAGFEKYPATLVNPDSGSLKWFLDRAAAEKL